ncbi:hypothetical protein [Pseudothermotoga sp.]|jgi:hypothetical protein|uniref:hypothetical protein n=1 Tax=Pseudothermotoga sp. TaxID=2033661 RepID=UPI002586A6AE|nr:hypothetical protein [Pseudothermotoga sp.]MDK2883972.1 hypothetical protein [Pseudothermotoga sp.]
MKGVKFWLFAIATVAVLAMVGCGPMIPIKSSFAHNVVEVTANVVDDDLEDLASWCDGKNILMLWYDFDSQPAGFGDRDDVFSGSPVADKNVYIDNQYAGNYDIETIETIENSINNLKVSLSGTLILYLKANDLLGTSWDLIIGEDNETKAITNYVLVEFEVDSTGVYKVTKVQVNGEWENLSVPKNITDITNKGFAFFRIDDDKVVDARVIYP